MSSTWPTWRARLHIDYELFWATQVDNIIHEALDGRVDGARARRTLERFELDLAEGAMVVARLGGEEAITLAVRVAGGRTLGSLRPGERQVDRATPHLPADLPRARYTVEIAAPEGKSFVALHYWVFGSRK